MKEKIKRVLTALFHNKRICGIAIVLVGVISLYFGASYVDQMLFNRNDTLKEVNDTSEICHPIIVIDDAPLKKHSPVQFFETFSSIKGMEDMNNFIVVYTKSPDIRQVVIKDKNSGEIYCYECRRINEDGYEIIDSFVRKNKIDTADKMKGM